MIWITTLLWIIHKPSAGVIISEIIILSIAFTVRYNALIYPIIAIFAFYLSSLPMRHKVGGIVSGLILCATFAIYTGYNYKAITGIWQYSPFSGWQLANNAMYAYRYVDKNQRQPVPIEFRKLDAMITSYFDSTHDTRKFPAEAEQANTAYMWDRKLPLYSFENKIFANDSLSSDLKKWATMGPIYSRYGLYIIRTYPKQYLAYFIWPNFIKYYSPPIEYLGSYNSRKDSVLPIAQSWFGYKSLKITTRTESTETNILDFYPILSGVANVIMAFGILSFFLLNGFQNRTFFRKGILLVGFVWIINAVFTIMASSAALRFQSFPILLSTIFSLILADRIWNVPTLSNNNIKSNKYEITS